MTRCQELTQRLRFDIRCPWVSDGGISMKDYAELFNESYQRALAFREDGQQFLDRFYETFFSKAREIAELFETTHMGTQKTMLQDSLFYMRDFFLHRKANEHMVRLAKIHSRAGKNIPPALYDVWLDSLIETVQEYDPEFDDDIELAWRIALSPGITYMKYMYDRG